MELVLTVDLSASPGKLRLLQLSGSDTIFIEEQSIESPKSDITQSTSSENSVAENFEQEPSGTNDTVVSDSQSSAATAELQPSQYSLPQQLQAAVARLTQPWSTAVVIAPPKDYFSLNLELPFKDDKNISKLLDLEVQDRVPFATQDFFFEHLVVGKKGEKLFDIHVGAIERNSLSLLLSACQKAGIDPLVITPYSNLIAPIIAENPDDFAPTCAFILEHSEFWYIIARVDGTLCFDRVIPFPQIQNGVGPHTYLASELKRTLAACESRYQLTFEQIWVCVETLETSEVGELIQRSVLPILSRTKLGCLLDHSASIFSDGQAKTALVNFRVGPFAYTLKWGELLFGLKACLSYFALSAVAIIVMLGITFIVREREISHLESELTQKIKVALGDIPLTAGKETEVISMLNNRIEDQLKTLGSPARISPLWALSNISQDVPQSSSITIKDFRVRGNEIALEGSAQSYSQIEELENALKNKKTVYCKVSRDVSGSANTSGNRVGLGFRFDVRLCD